MRDAMLIVHFIGLAMGVGTSFAYMFLGIASSKLPPEEAVKFQLKTLALSRMGQIGLALLLISGFYLITPFWEVLGDMPWLIVKLSLVLVLILLLIMIGLEGRKAKSGDPAKHFKKIRPMGMIALLVGLAIILAAVQTFH